MCKYIDPAALQEVNVSPTSNHTRSYTLFGSSEWLQSGRGWSLVQAPFLAAMAVLSVGKRTGSTTKARWTPGDPSRDGIKTGHGVLGGKGGIGAVDGRHWSAIFSLWWEHWLCWLTGEVMQGWLAHWIEAVSEALVRVGVERRPSSHNIRASLVPLVCVSCELEARLGGETTQLEQKARLKQNRQSRH
ncbi:unnamed protein product [Protopolystoma xenopodis]|uniref:Uncharacterized protein n=1 Tax=Protopolystoma xenopodis TaxID=117903 RepID=A0A448WUQ5_9PLAT|nr:unnamed protein product [Protopolystoma xenopodis]